MFPYQYRANAMALATSSNWIWNFLLAFFTPFITGAIDFSYGYVFAGCNFAGAAIVYFFLIESAGRTIEEIDTMYLIHVPPMKSSSWTSEMVEEQLSRAAAQYSQNSEGLRSRMRIARSQGAKSGNESIKSKSGRSDVPMAQTITDINYPHPGMTRIETTQGVPR
jgi:SP family sugar:H+ symporter-like MFS transporter